MGEVRLARLANEQRLLAGIGRRRVVHQRAEDLLVSRPAAPQGVTVTLDEVRALDDFEREGRIAPQARAYRPQPALDGELLLAEAPGMRAPAREAREQPYEEPA